MQNHKPLTPNSTQIPNIILDFVIPRISEADGKVLLYICRRTYGFQKEQDRISLSQFVDGIKDRNDRTLDYGCGVSRPAVVEALKNLVGSKLVTLTKSSLGNIFAINCGLLVDNSVDNLVVKKINQLRKLTNIGKRSKPILVKEVNPQNKGNKGNKVITNKLKDGTDDEKAKALIREAKSSIGKR